MFFRTHDVNYAFHDLVTYFAQEDKPLADLSVRRSRFGNCISYIHPITVQYQNPRQRVLVNAARDCNPFFHLFESMWMLAGRNDLSSLLTFNKSFAQFSDDGKTVHGAYGHRWRFWSQDSLRHDQIKNAIRTLREDPDSRRVVIQMYDPAKDKKTALFPDQYKDCPCNTTIYLERCDGKLNMTVCNRSNDLIWGMLGANVVHMSFLQEYIACALDVSIGKYNQISNNLHVYDNNFKSEKWLDGFVVDWYHDNNVIGDPDRECPPLFTGDVTVEPKFFNELCRAVELYGNWGDYKRVQVEGTKWEFTFLELVFKPMCLAFIHHKARSYDEALAQVDNIIAYDWHIEAKRWIQKRRDAYEAKDA